MGFLTEKLSFDFGTSSIRIVKNGKLVLQDACQIEISSNSEVVATGNNVSELRSNKIINPVNSGVIADFNAFEQFLRDSIKKIPNRQKFILPPSLVTLALVSESCSEVDLRAVRDSLEHAGSRNTHMLYSSFATAKGIGLDNKDTFLILDAGAGKISTTIISSDRLYCPHRLYFGAIKLKEIISLHIEQNHGAKCDKSQLEEILTNYITILGDPITDKTKITRTDNNSIYESFDLNLTLLNQRLAPYFQQIDDEILLTIEAFKHQSDKPIQFIVLTGGLSRIHGLEKRISQLTKLPILNKSDKDYTLRGLTILDADFVKNKKVLK